MHVFFMPSQASFMHVSSAYVALDLVVVIRLVQREFALVREHFVASVALQ